MALIRQIEREDPHRSLKRCIRHPERFRRKIDVRQPVHFCYPWDPLDLRAKLLGGEGHRSIRGKWSHILAARDGALRSQSGEGGHDRATARHVGQGDRCAGCDRADVEAGPCQSLSERAATSDVGNVLAVQGRAPVDVGQRRRWLVVDHHLVHRFGRGVDNRQCEGRTLPGAERSSGNDVFVESQSPPER